MPADGGTPLLWVWLLVAFALLAVMLLLLFSPSRWGGRGRARHDASARAHAEGRT